MYSFKDDFGIPSVSPANLDTLIKKMVKDEKLAYKYFEYKYKLGDLMLAKGCDRVRKFNKIKNDQILIFLLIYFFAKRNAKLIMCAQF